MKIAYLPIETETREIDSNITLGLYLVEKKNFDHVIIGEKRILSVMARLRLLPAGIYHLKSAQHYLLPFLKCLNKQGFKFTLQNAESLVTFDDDDRKDMFMIPPETIDYIAKVFCANSQELDTLKTIYKNVPDNKFVLSGFLRTQGSYEEISKYYADEIRDIKARYGKYILYNSTAGLFFHGIKSSSLAEIRTNLVEQGIMDDHVDVLMEWGRQSQATFFSFLEFVRLFKNKYNQDDVKIVFRPHPAENVEFFRYIFSDDKQILIDSSYSVVPWLIASEINIGSTSTTLVESAALGKPTLSYVPEINSPVMDVLNNNVSNLCGKISTSPNELLADIVDIFDEVDGNKYNNQRLAVEILGKEFNTYEQFSTHMNSLTCPSKNKRLLNNLKLSLLSASSKLSYFIIKLRDFRSDQKKQHNYWSNKFQNKIEVTKYKDREYPKDLNGSNVNWKTFGNKGMLFSRIK